MNGMSRKLLGESVWKQDTPHHPKALPCRLLMNFKGGKGTLKQRTLVYIIITKLTNLTLPMRLGDILSPRIWNTEKNTSTYVIILIKTFNQTPLMGETIRYIYKLRDILQNHWLGPFDNVNVIKDYTVRRQLSLVVPKYI